MIQIIGLILIFATGILGGLAPSWFIQDEKPQLQPQPQFGAATTIGIRQGGTQTSTVPANAQFLIGNDTLYVFSAIPNCNTEGTDKLLFNSSTFAWTCGADQTGTATEAGWRGDGIHTRLTTSTNRVGIGATSTLDYKLFVQSTAIGSSTLILRATSTQTANLFQTQDINNVISFLITPGGLASSTELRVTSSTIGTLVFTNASGTNLTASGYLWGDTLRVIAQSDLGSVSSTNLEASGYLRVLSRSRLDAVSSTNLRASGYLEVTASTTMSAYASCTSLETNANGLVLCGSDAEGGGGGSSTVSHVFDLGDAILPNTAFPSFDKTIGTNWVYNYLSFDATTSECSYWQWTVPSSTPEVSHQLNLNWFSTSGTDGQFTTFDVDMRFASSGQLLDATTSTNMISVSGSSTIPAGSTSTVNRITIDMGSSSLIAGRSLGQLKVCRDVAEDNATGDSKLLPITWESSN